MRKRGWTSVGLAIALLLAAGNGRAEETATTDEVFQKLIQAAEVIQALAPQGDDWLDAFNHPESEFCWKDTYVWVIDAERYMNVAHPINQNIVGVVLTDIQCRKTGAYFYQEFLKAADNPNGVWSEYWWPKPEDPDSLYRKITLVIPVAGTPYLVAAGIYDEDRSLDELNKMLQ